MKKKSFFKTELKNYFIQFTIVAAGVLVTFIGSALITRCSTQKEIKSAMHLIIEELEENRTRLKEITYRMEAEARIATYLNKCKWDCTQLPADTLNKYGSFVTSSSSFEYLTDALEVLKNSSLTQSISDKKLILAIIRSYEGFRMIQKNIDAYYQLKMSVIEPIFMNMTDVEHNKIRASINRTEELKYALVLWSPRMRNFCQTAPGFIGEDFLPNKIQQLDESIAMLKQRYQ
jgi:hypothetical protein